MLSRILPKFGTGAFMQHRPFLDGLDNPASRDSRHEQPSQQFIVLNGGRISCTTSGRGTPTVVLETGLMADSDEWGPIQNALSPYCRVFRYDRPGRGRSDPPVAVRDVTCIATELHALLAATKMPSPYLLVGHSFGGLIAGTFARRYRADVCGLVLVESMHPRQFDVFGDSFPPPSESDTPDQTRMRKFWQGEWRAPQSTSERLDLTGSLSACLPIASLGALPVTVITAESYSQSRFFSAATRDPLQASWNTLQREWLLLSSHAVQIHARGAQHHVQRDRPDYVIEAVAAILSGTHG